MNKVNIADMKVTNLRMLTLDDPDTNDNVSFTVNGTVASGSKADFSGFKGAVTLTDNVGFATVILADAHANTITLTWPRIVVDALFFWDREHCRESYVSEVLRMQCPPELRE